MPAIRFIVEVVTSERDVSGNCYRLAHLTSTKTGNRLTVRDVGGENNVQYWLSAHMHIQFYPTVFAVGRTVTKKQYRALDADAKKNGAPYELTRALVEGLEVEAPAE